MSIEHEGPRPALGIGARLRNAREEKGLTLRQIEERTKIRARYLEDLERENFGVLPAVYVLGSLRTYADHLGLDGEALSAELRSRLEPDEPEVEGPAQNENPTEDEYGAAPLLTVGFDHLFLGMGLVLISTFAVMTLVFTLATDEGPLISQVREPAMPEAPAEIALAGNVLEEPGRQPRNETSAPEPQSEAKDDQGANRPDPPKDDVALTGQEPRDASSQPSFFDGMKFVRTSPAAFPTTSASASAASTSAASASAASASPQPTASETPAPSGTAPPADVPTTVAPTTDVPSASASAPAASAPAASAPAAPASAGPASAAPASAASASPASAAPEFGAVGAGSEPAPTTVEPAPAPAARASVGTGIGEVEPGGLDTDGLAGGITDQVEDIVDPVR